MKFGKWLTAQRNKKKVDQPTLAKVAGITLPTVNRIENAKIEDVTLGTAIRLCLSLDLTWRDLIAEHQPKSNPRLALSLKDRKGNLRLAEIERWVALQAQTSEQGQQVLKHLIKLIPEPTAYRVDSEVKLPTVAHYQFAYPPKLEIAQVFAMYEQGEFLIPQDAGLCLKGFRLQRGLSLDKIESQTKISQSVLSRLENGALKQLKLKDVLELDKSLEAEGDLLAVFWRAFAFQTGVLRSRSMPSQLPPKWEPLELHSATVLLLAYRWICADPDLHHVESRLIQMRELLSSKTV